ncbi:hypothetical protein GWI33_012448, partial [Rhynchophorus ferrugineus]
EHPETEAAFVCNASDDTDLYLEFTTEKSAVGHLLVGSLKSIARILYTDRIEVVTSRCWEAKGQFKYHIRRMDSDSRNGTDRVTSPLCDSPTSDSLPMSISTFCRAFPWHFVIVTETGFQLRNDGSEPHKEIRKFTVS